MKKINYIDSIRNPIMTEKATILSEQNKNVFRVHEKANKKLIKKNIDFAGNNNLRKTLKLEAKHLIMSSNSEEHKLAVAKFKEK